MSMLIRTGTLVRKSSRKATIRRTKSAGSTTSGSHPRPLDNDGLSSATSSVPGTPIAKLHNLYTDPILSSSPGKSSVTTNSTVVSYEDHRQVFKTHIERTYSTDQGSYTTNQDTVLQIEEAKKESDNICDFICSSAQIICSSS
uniref:Uncharacterized protein n=1 Tax=Biomphalaria glabrata TaxID=6526 RepID=A0A2C9JP72_BIOGL